jgi:hypothetical protein
MRTRSGLTLSSRESQESTDMAEDAQSTEAQWGTPAHTAR